MMSGYLCYIQKQNEELKTSKRTSGGSHEWIDEPQIKIFNKVLIYKNVGKLWQNHKINDQEHSIFFNPQK